MVPLILSIGIIPAISSSDISEYTQICVDKVWLESTNGRITCVTPSTADRLVQRGWGTLLDIEKVMEEPSGEIDEKSITPVVLGGTQPITATPIIGDPSKQYPENYIPGTEESTEEAIPEFQYTSIPNDLSRA